MAKSTQTSPAEQILPEAGVHSANGQAAPLTRDLAPATPATTSPNPTAWPRPSWTRWLPSWDSATTSASIYALANVS